MKTTRSHRTPDEAGGALMMTMIMTGVALAILASAMAWSANSTRLTHRAIQYNRSVAAAEAATEKVMSQMSQDFLFGGELLVTDNLKSYRQTVPKSSDSSLWQHWQFDDGNGRNNRTSVELLQADQYVSLNSAYAGLRGFVSTYTIVSHARDLNSSQTVVGGVLQEVQLARIPIFQFAMYSSGDMEISCGQPFSVTGRVHSNGKLYVEPDNVLTFESDVTSVGDIVFDRHPLDTRDDPSGGAVYVYPERKVANVAAMTLPIGATNTPLAIREIIQPPPAGEDPTSPIGRLRYYNQVEMIIVVSNSSISAFSGRFNGFSTPIPTNELVRFVSTNSSFRDAREEKTVRPIDINIGVLKIWSETNSNLRTALGSRDVRSIYVRDRRTLSSSQLSAVRVSNGKELPARGLTIATDRPLYVRGHYNASTLASTNTLSTRPASFVADAITILSEGWSDANSTSGLDSRQAKPTTVNAALLTGVVETAKQPAPLTGYSGGMENFPRFLESWGKANVLTYNGSMVKMFPSRYATNAWGKDEVYNPPARNWAYDRNFEDASKLPPLTPSLQKVVRGQWATVPAGKNTVASK